jgi:hypothetical protein
MVLGHRLAERTKRMVALLKRLVDRSWYFQRVLTGRHKVGIKQDLKAS